jgi:hypothetical protein
MTWRQTLWMLGIVIVFGAIGGEHSASNPAREPHRAAHRAKRRLPRLGHMGAFGPWGIPARGLVINVRSFCRM